MIKLAAGLALLSACIPPITDKPMYVNPELPYTQQAQIWDSAFPEGAAIMREYASIPMAKWFNTDPAAYLSRVPTGQVPIIVMYNIPNRDCGTQFSAGGASSNEEYKQFVDSVARAISDPDTIIILEPDALADLDCLPDTLKWERLGLLKYALDTLPARVYIDGGNPRWQSYLTMAQRLNWLGNPNFVLNTSYYETTNVNIMYGTAISNYTNGAHFVIDTSRNGVPPVDDQFCNPPNRMVGQRPTFNTNQPLVDAYLWIKEPGGSDGECNRGEPPAGHWWPVRALELWWGP